ncbi:hypothetical protein J2Z22_000864 [Paenibacillus forsythiae]|uniref:Uncharacterized protein n=2 Tax=Paenibacillus forsythiae TaxID=365616 RepID=A0ABU3H3F1_9BACL|nr:pilus assembly protein [Paenibacillus forsythiae]MDT3425348.1 hypothetical protein [Paenibacillus forsythiae]
MKKKGAFLTTLALATCVTVAATASTIQESTYTSESGVVASPSENTTSTKSLDGKSIITPMLVDDTWSDTANNGTANVQNFFNVNTGYSHLKLYMHNFSSHPVHVNLTHLESGKVYFSKDIPANDYLDWRNWLEGYPQGMRGGNYILQWSGGSYNVNGQYFGKTASSTTDF